MAALDVESSGVDVENDRIVTACVALVGGGIAPETLSLVADPGIEIPEGAAAIHGYADVLAAIVAALAPAAAAGYPLVAMNAPFDLTMLDRELRRHGLEPLPAFRVVDPYVLDRFLDKFRRGSRKLEALCAHYDVGLDGAHDAAFDALAAARLAYRIGQRGEVKRRVRNAADGRELARLKREWSEVRSDLDALHAAQVRWARGQAESLRDHFIRQGEVERAASVRMDWPCIPFAAERAAA